MININRVKVRLEQLGQFGRDKRGGWSRLSYTAEYFEAVKLVKSWMHEAGLEVHADPVGNTIGRLPGQDDRLPVVASGSHIDTVENGGMFDGNLGVIAALEVAQSLKDNGVENKYPLEVIVFIEEEGIRFQGLLGSRAMIEGMTCQSLQKLKDKNGVLLVDEMVKAGLEPKRVPEAKVDPHKFRCFFELHVEQGAVLESLGINVGLVEGIVGIVHSKAKLVGVSNHAGGTPFSLRKDALAAAAEIILAAEKIARDEAGRDTVATIGRLLIDPNTINTIAGNVEMTFDIRDIDKQVREKVVSDVLQVMEEICVRRKISHSYDEIHHAKGVILPTGVVDLLESSAVDLGIKYHRMVSGAGHDAQIMAKCTDVGMIFVPSKDGISHSHREWTELDQIEEGIKVLYEAIRRKVI